MSDKKQDSDIRQISIWQGLAGVFEREFKLSIRLGSAITLVVGFYVFVIMLLPLSLGANLALLARIGPGVLWIGLVLSLLMTLDRIFQMDVEDGSLDLFLMSPLPLELIVFIKCLVHWVTHAAPLIFISPLLALLLNMEWRLYPPLVVTLLIGSPGLVFAGAIGAALSATLKRAGILTALFVLPLYVPVVIFAVGYVGQVADGFFFNSTSILPGGQGLLLLGAYSLFMVALAPLAAAGALRANMS